MNVNANNYGALVCIEQWKLCKRLNVFLKG